jgi:ribosome-associated toxin RatA of RatAB toxin-antitoxin module
MPLARSMLTLGVVAAVLSVPGFASSGDDLPAKGQVEVKSYAVAGSGTPRIVARAVMDLPPKKIWAIVSDCAHYKEHLPRIAASELVKKEGNVHTCKVTVSMPFPLSDLTGVTAAVHEETEAGMSRRWKLVSGDYKVNDGSWEVRPIDKAGTQSLVTYSIHAEPNTSVPDWIRESAQKKVLPEMIERVRLEAAKL